MTIVFSGKVFSDVVVGTTNTYYSPPEFNASLGSGEAWFAELKSTNVQGASPKAKVVLEVSNDEINWSARSTIIGTNSISNGAVLSGFDADAVTGAVAGQFARLAVSCPSGTSPSAYIEVWVTARSVA